VVSPIVEDIPMKVFSRIVALFLLVCLAAPVVAQQGRPGAEPRDRKPDSHGKTEAQQPARTEPRRREPAAQPGRSEQEPRTRPTRPETRGAPSGTRRSAPPARHLERDGQREAWRGQRAQHWESEHRSWKQRGGYHGYRIPPARLRIYFGREHWFHLFGAPMVMVGRHPRFKYAGYWFRLVDPWPESWVDDWYERDDVSIDYYRDGYYLCDRSHPGVLIAVEVYLP
jgi:hypothetical protein